jgi:hypothetical protein
MRDYFNNFLLISLSAKISFWWKNHKNYCFSHCVVVRDTLNYIISKKILPEYEDAFLA